MTGLFQIFANFNICYKICIFHAAEQIVTPVTFMCWHYLVGCFFLFLGLQQELDIITDSGYPNYFSYLYPDLMLWYLQKDHMDYQLKLKCTKNE